MKIEIKNWLLVTIIITLAGVLFVGGWVLGRKAIRDSLLSRIEIQDQVIRTYLYKISDLEKIAREKEQIVATQKEIIRKGEISKEELEILNYKSLSEITALRGEVRILRDSIKHTGVVVIDSSENIVDPFIILPFNFYDSTKYYNIWGGFDTLGIMSLGLDVPVELDVITGKDPEIKGNYKVTVTSTNPYVNITGIKSYKFDVQKPRKFGIGFQFGYGLGLKQYNLQPYFGVGISYNLLRF